MFIKMIYLHFKDVFFTHKMKHLFQSPWLLMGGWLLFRVVLLGGSTARIIKHDKHQISTFIIMQLHFHLKLNKLIGINNIWSTYQILYTTIILLFQRPDATIWIYYFQLHPIIKQNHASRPLPPPVLLLGSKLFFWIS